MAEGSPPPPPPPRFSLTAAATLCFCCVAVVLPMSWSSVPSAAPEGGCVPDSGRRPEVESGVSEAKIGLSYSCRVLLERYVMWRFAFDTWAPMMETQQGVFVDPDVGALDQIGPSDLQAEEVNRL